MTSKAKQIAESLKNLESIAYRYNIDGEVLEMDSGDFEQLMLDAADMIEELSAKVAEYETQIAGLETMLTAAQSAAETWQRRAEAAEVDGGMCGL